MRNLIVLYENDVLKTRREDIPIPVPASHEVLIEVEFAGSNQKDFKHPLPALFDVAVNQGDDCSGTVSKVGSAVKRFKPGERVAGFHIMDSPTGGTYADYALCPEQTVFHIPNSMSYEEAATIPLAAYTAATGLYRNLGIPAPWDRSDAGAAEQSKIPLVINGGSSAVGAFAIKLAQMNPRVSPIIATAGTSASFVRALGVDAVVDYRSPSAVEEIKQALGNAKLRHVFDASNSPSSVKMLTAVMQPGSRFTCTQALHTNPGHGVDDSQTKALEAIGAWYEFTYVGDVHEQVFPGTTTKSGGILFGGMISLLFESALAKGTMSGQPYEIVKDGLDGVLEALLELRDRTRGGNAKFVTRIADTKS